MCTFTTFVFVASIVRGRVSGRMRPERFRPRLSISGTNATRCTCGPRRRSVFLEDEGGKGEKGPGFRHRSLALSVLLRASPSPCAEAPQIKLFLSPRRRDDNDGCAFREALYLRATIRLGAAVPALSRLFASVRKK